MRSVRNKDVFYSSVFQLTRRYDRPCRPIFAGRWSRLSTYSRNFVASDIAWIRHARNTVLYTEQPDAPRLLNVDQPALVYLCPL